MRAAIYILLFNILAAATLTLPFPARAGAEESEIRITGQPDRLILELGPQWAGAEFELRTDAGVFPAAVTADLNGVLRMDLGGSKTYTLRYILPHTALPDPQAEAETAAEPGSDVGEAGTGPEANLLMVHGIPVFHIAGFIAGLSAVGSSLIAMRLGRRRLGAYDYDDEDYGEDYRE